MPQIVSIKDNRSLSPPEVARGRTICEEARASVLERPEYIRRHAVDPRFALPDANWSYDAPNEFVQLFRRVCDADARTFEHLRGLSQVFTGYNIYEVCNARGLSVANLPLTDALDATTHDHLERQNGPQLALWQHITQGIPRRFIFSPARLLGEVGHDVDGVVVNSDTCTYQERRQSDLRVRNRGLDRSHDRSDWDRADLRDRRRVRRFVLMVQTGIS